VALMPVAEALARVLAEAEPLLRRYEGAFTYVGQVPRDRLRWYYSQASVLVLPSIEEGLALVLAQALACGLPVVATANSRWPCVIAGAAQKASRNPR